MIEWVKNISLQMLDYYIEEKDNKTLIIDVREKRKYNIRHICGAINIPYEEIQLRFKEIPKDKKIIVYCERGGASMASARFLQSKGYEVINVVGGIRGYKGKNIE